MKEESEKSLYEELETELTQHIESLVDSVGYNTFYGKACTGETIVTFAVMFEYQDEFDDAIETFLQTIESYRNGLKVIKNEGEDPIYWKDAYNHEATLYWRRKPTIEHDEVQGKWYIRTRLLMSSARELKITDHGYTHAMRGIREEANNA